MSNVTLPEVWLRGPVAGVPSLLQPVAHGLMQCREELDTHVSSLSPGELWTRLSGVASIGFHVRHAAGSLDRLFTYARGEALSPAQRAALAAEREPDLAPDAARTLLAGFDRAVEGAIGQLRATDEATILDPRGVGRAQLPSTVLGLLFHAAEHTQRHVGQAVTTARALAGGAQGATGESGKERTTSGRAAGTFEVTRSPIGMHADIVEADLSRPDHQEAVVALIAAYAKDPMGNSGPLPPDVMERLIPGLRAHPTTLILLAYADGRPIGIASCFVGFSTFYARPLVNIHDLAILPEFRGREVGRRLLDAVSDKAKALGCCKVTLEVHESNAKARRMYEAAGFAPGAAREPGGRWLFYARPL
jgi:ribosomal protein S18 acetylase RimI-like enzyme/uncharacterized damage-inducible protein DinB